MISAIFLFRNHRNIHSIRYLLWTAGWESAPTEEKGDMKAVDLMASKDIPGLSSGCEYDRWGSIGKRLAGKGSIQDRDYRTVRCIFLLCTSGLLWKLSGGGRGEGRGYHWIYGKYRIWSGGAKGCLPRICIWEFIPIRTAKKPVTIPIGF